jgi:DNA-binding transcriptional ArsR family regulator
VATDGQGAAAVALDALGDPTRRRILELLAAEPSAVRALADQLPISRPAVSRHLKLLKGAGLVADEAAGTQRVYRLQPEGIEALRAYFEQLWNDAAQRYRVAAENTRRR